MNEAVSLRRSRSPRRQPAAPPAVRPTRHDVLADFRRSELLSAARVVFAEHGFERATMERVAEHAGVAKGTVYLYFSSKRGLYLAALTQGLTGLHDLLRSRIDPKAPCSRNLRAFIETKMAFFDTDRDFFRIYLDLGLPPVGSACADPVLQRQYRAQHRLLHQLLARAVERREIRDVPLEPLTDIVAQVTRTVVARRLEGRASATVEEDAGLAMDLLWGGLALR